MVTRSPETHAGEAALLDEIDEFRALGDAADRSLDIWLPRLDHVIQIAQGVLWPHVAASHRRPDPSSEADRMEIARRIGDLLAFREHTRAELPSHLRELRSTAYGLHAIARLYVLREQAQSEIAGRASAGCHEYEARPSDEQSRREEERTMPEATEVDVRTVPPRDRHPMIFNTFDALPRGGVLRLVNDHDPRPLYYQFQAERAGQFRWEPAEEGPERWVILIHREG